MPRIDPDKYKLKEPEENPEGEKSLEDKILEIANLEQRSKERHREGGEEVDYWQGRKDGLRLALAILEPDESIWKRLTASSPGFRTDEDEKELLLKFLKDARINIGAALDDYAEKPDRKIHIYTIVNLLQWIQQYEWKAERGEVTPAPEAITPDWGLLTRRKRSKG